MENKDEKPKIKKTIKVVEITKDGPIGKILSLEKNEYKYNDNGQITLPEKHYSAGYYERLTGLDWDNLNHLTKENNK